VKKLVEVRGKIKGQEVEIKVILDKHMPALVLSDVIESLRKAFKAYIDERGDSLYETKC